MADADPTKILDDVDLIMTLESAKQTAKEIMVSIENSVKLEAKINMVRNSYKPVSARGSILFFVIKDLANTDPMYQYSLQYITRLFKSAMQIAEKKDKPEERLLSLIDSITEVIYTNVCRGLFEKDKLTFSFLIASSIKKHEGKLN